MKRLIPLLMLLAALYAAAQYKLPDNIPTPNASDLGSYGEIPISYYTGKADISIPLYTLDERGVTLPVTLHYDASGVQMNSLPGWTGHNWLLSAGGAITRKMNYRCDEYIYPEHVNMYLSYPTRNYFQSYASLPTIMAGDDNNHTHLKDSVIYGHNDFSPDVFYFNAMGLSGRFFLGNDGEWKVYCDKNVEVVFDINDGTNYISPFISHYPRMEGSAVTFNQPKTIKGFILRDENGTEYHFGGSTDYIEYFTYFFRSGDGEREASWLANSWYLAKVKDRLGNELYRFTYQRGKFIAQFYNGFEETTVNYNQPHWSSGMYIMSNNDFPYNAQLLSPIYLSSIETLSGKNNLIFNSTDMTIPMTTIYSGLYNLGYLSTNFLSGLVPGSTWSFRPFYYLQTNNADVTPYQYAGYGGDKMTMPLESTCMRRLVSIIMPTLSSTSGTRNYIFEYTSPRMFLAKIKLMDKRIHYAPTDAFISEYRFKYNHLDCLPTDYLTRATDHWGYYNGSSYAIPTTTGGKRSFHLLRNPNGSRCQYGMLSEIVYPTGGKSVLEFEPNDFSRHLNTTRTYMTDSAGLAGGVRIKSIKEYDDTLGATLLRSRTFSYQDPVTHHSSGELFAKPRYYWENWTVWNGNANVTQQFFRTTSILPLSNSFGPHYGYSYVTETDGDKVTEYHYSNISDSMDEPFTPVFSNTIGTPYDEFSERGYRRGKLLSVKRYSGSLLKEETNYAYRADNVEAKYVLTANLAYENLGPSGAYGNYRGGVYKLFYPKYDILQETRRTHDDSNMKPTHITYTRKDTILRTSLGGFTHNVEVRYLENENTRKEQPEKDVCYEYSFNDATAYILAANSFVLTPLRTSTYLEHVLQERHSTHYAWISGNYLPAYETKKSSGYAVEDTLVSYISYTPTGLPARYQRKGEDVTMLVWDADDKHLLAKIVGNMPPLSPPFNGNTTQRQMIDFFNGYRLAHYAQVTSYTYDENSLLTSVTDPLGYTTYYYYDEYNRLTDVRDSNGALLRHFDYNYRNHQ